MTEQLVRKMLLTAVSCNELKTTNGQGKMMWEETTVLRVEMIRLQMRVGTRNKRLNSV